jgi:hypothetical protein
MSTELEHPAAYYFDDNGIQQRILAEDLSNVTTRAFAAEQKLTDKTGQVDLHPRVPSEAVPHFVATGVRGTRSIYEGERDPTHDARVSALLGKLKTRRTWKLALGEAVSQTGQPLEWKLTDPIALSAYEWDDEVYRIMAKDTIVRHDLFGQALRLDMSVNQPWVAIEVVHSHFPEEKAFAAMLEMSERVPFYVLFDFTAMKDKFVRVESESDAIIFRDWTYLIHDGHVWKGGKKQDIRTSAALKVHILEMFAGWNVKF